MSVYSISLSSLMSLIFASFSRSLKKFCNRGASRLMIAWQQGAAIGVCTWAEGGERGSGGHATQRTHPECQAGLDGSRPTGMRRLTPPSGASAPSSSQPPGRDVACRPPTWPSLSQADRRQPSQCGAIPTPPGRLSGRQPPTPCAGVRCGLPMPRSAGAP